MTKKRFFSAFIMFLILAGCAGVKVVNPNKNQNKDAGTLMLDVSEGKPKFVSTFTCNLESTGNRFSAVGKSEEEARKEVLARCRDKSIISFCNASKVSCVRN